MTTPDLAHLPEVLKPIAPLYLWLARNFVPWGLVLLCLSSAAENWLIIGLLTPGEVLIVAGAFIAADIGLHLGIVLVVSLIGSTAGIVAAYFLGRKLGMGGLQTLLTRWNSIRHLPPFLKISQHMIDDLGQYFQTHGAVTSFTARFAYGVKACIPPVAGATNMNFPAFLATSVLGGALYTTLLVAAGWFLQKNAHIATSILKGLSTAGVLILIALLLFAALAFKRIADTRRSRKAKFGNPSGSDSSETKTP